jgi:hypothetical protein
MALAITTTEIALPANAPVLAVLQASGNAGPVLWSLMSGTKLPGGLMLDQSGRITGTAGIAGTFTFTVSATDTGPIQPAEGGAGTQGPATSVGASVTITLS